MTEKRFTLIDDYLIEYEGDVFDLHKPSDIRSFVTVIGYVTDENEQLKQRNNRLEENIQIERRVSVKQHLKWSKEAENKIKELSKENEQLKQYKQAVSDVLRSWSQKKLSAKQLQVVIAIMEELNILGDVE